MLQIVVTVPIGEMELASHTLWGLGVVAIEEREHADSHAADGELDEELIELWTALGDDPHAVARAAEVFPTRWRWRLVEIDARIAETWRNFATPTWVADDLVIVPAWVPFALATAMPTSEQPHVQPTVVRIDPGATFGMGDHPTTVLTIRGMRNSLFPGATVLDVGCGSGVLSVAACLLGASHAEAVDISPASVSVTNDNAVMNGVGDRIDVSNDALADVEGTFDVVLANILSPALIELSDDLRRVVAPSGVLVISGLLDGRSDHVVDALRPMVVIDRQTMDGWVAITLRH